jgi:hypothetical protein
MNIFSKIFDKFTLKDPPIAEQILTYLRKNPDQQFGGIQVNPDGTAGPLRFTQLGHSLWSGRMGSGKTIANVSSLAGHILAHPQDLVLIINPIQRVEDYRIFFNLHRVIPFTGDYDIAVAVIDWLYLEVLARRQSGQSPAGNIVVVLEDQNYFNFNLTQSQNQLNPDLTFLKLKILMDCGSRYGIYFRGVYQSVGSSAELPSEILIKYHDLYGFRMDKPDAIRLGTKSDTIPNDLKGYCYTPQGTYLKFLYLDQYVIADLINEELQARIHSNQTPDWLITANAQKLQDWKRSPQWIINHYRDPRFQDLIHAPVEDLDFWDFINQGPEAVKIK